MSLQKIPVEQNLDKSTPNQIVVSPTTTFFGGGGVSVKSGEFQT
jgi:hypothetical protein